MMWHRSGAQVWQMWNEDLSLKSLKSVENNQKILMLFQNCQMTLGFIHVAHFLICRVRKSLWGALTEQPQTWGLYAAYSDWQRLKVESFLTWVTGRNRLQRLLGMLRGRRQRSVDAPSPFQRWGMMTTAIWILHNMDLPVGLLQSLQLWGPTLHIRLTCRENEWSSSRKLNETWTMF